jgi:hypothetical protein
MVPGIFCQADTHRKQEKHSRAIIGQNVLKILILQDSMAGTGSYGRFFHAFMLSVVRLSGNKGRNERLMIRIFYE